MCLYYFGKYFFRKADSHIILQGERIIPSQVITGNVNSNTMLQGSRTTVTDSIFMIFNV